MFVQENPERGQVLQESFIFSFLSYLANMIVIIFECCNKHVKECPSSKHNFWMKYEQLSFSGACRTEWTLILPFLFSFFPFFFFNFSTSFFDLCSKYLSVLMSRNLSPTSKTFHMTRDSSINRFKNPRLHSCTGYNKITSTQNISTKCLP